MFENASCFLVFCFYFFAVNMFEHLFLEIKKMKTRNVLPQTFKKTKLLKLMFALNVCQDLRSWCTADEYDSNEFLSQFSLSPLRDVCLAKNATVDSGTGTKMEEVLLASHSHP